MSSWYHASSPVGYPTKTFRVASVLAASVILGACAGLRPHQSGPVEPLDQGRAGAVSAAPSMFTQYERADAVALPGAQLWFNSDFDFAMAISDGELGIGPALAASKRQSTNRAAAALFANLPTNALSRCWRHASLGQHGEDGSPGRVGEVLLFGSPKAQLRVALATAGRHPRRVWYGPVRALSGAGGWSDDGGRLLRIAVYRAVEGLVAADPARASGQAESDYLVAVDGIAPIRQRGQLLERRQGRALVLGADGALYSYPEDQYQPSPTPPSVFPGKPPGASSRPGAVSYSK